MSLPILMIIGVLSFCAYMAVDEMKFNNELIDKALKGNANAIKILIRYKEPKKLPRRIVCEALEGNHYAIEALQIDDGHYRSHADQTNNP